MDIAIAIHNVWTDKIFSGAKPFEFRTKCPTNFNVGDKIYFYETAVNGGARAIVGECVVDEILPLLSPEGKWPICMTYHFIDYFFENIRKDKAKADIYRNVKERFKYIKTNIRFGSVISYALSDIYLDHLEKTGDLLDFFDIIHETGDWNLYNRITKERDECEKDNHDCDEWLESIGMYNEYGETYYKFAFHMINIKKYDVPIPLSKMICNTGEPVKGLQSFCYIKEVLL